MQMISHDGSMFSITFKHVKIQVNHPMHDRNTQCGRKKGDFLKISLYIPAKPFQTQSLILYYGYSHAHGHVYKPNLVHNSLDVRYTVFFYNYKFRERDDVGACCNIVLGAGCNIVLGACCNIVLGAGCNTVTVEQIACICGMNRANCDTDTTVGMLHFYSYQIHSVRFLRFAYRKSKMAAFFKDGHGLSKLIF